MFSQINIISDIQNPQLSEDMKEWTKFKRAQWMNLFRTEVPGDMTPPLITEHKYSSDMIEYHTLMISIGLMKELWEPFTLQELYEGAAKFCADINSPGSFDMTMSLQQIGYTLLENRYITRCELILVMKCPFLASHRLHAKEENFDWFNMQKVHQHTCPGRDTSNPCICAYIG
jgi:hypothetical protein